MTNVKVTAPITPSVEASPLTKSEILDITPSQRNIVLYERINDVLREQVKYLLEENRNHNRTILENERKLASLPQIKRGKTELYINTLFATALMGFGGGLVSSFPKTDQHIPWQFGAGWTMLTIGIILAIATRPLVWLVYYKFIAKKKPEA